MRNFGIVLVSLSDYAQATLSSIEMIGGTQEGIIALGLQPKADIAQFSSDILQAVNDLKDNYEEVVVFVDLYGATPYNVTMRLLKSGEDFMAYSGFNLALVLECLYSERRGRHEIDEMIKETMLQSLSNLNDLVIK